MKSQKCRISVLLMTLIFAVFACPLGTMLVQADNIDSDSHQTEAAADPADPGTSNVDPNPPSQVDPPSESSEPSLPPESSQTDPPPSSTVSQEPSEEPPPTDAPPEPTWAPDPTDPPNQGNTATITPRPAKTPSSSSSAGIKRPTATLKPNTDGSDASAGQKESNYVTFATMNVKQNSFAASLFYGGVACIALGSVGVVVLLVLFIKNRRYRKNDRDGIFEEIEHAEMRGRAAQDQQPTSARPAQPQHSGQINRPPARQQGQGTGEQPSPRRSNPNAIKPSDASLYTEELDIPAPRSATPRSPAPPAQKPAPSQTPQSGEKQFDTEEILREALYQDDDYDDL